MACDMDRVEALSDTQNNTQQSTYEKENKKMASSMVLQKTPEFKMNAYDAKTGHYKTVSSDDYKGK